MFSLAFTPVSLGLIIIAICATALVAVLRIRQQLKPFIKQQKAEAILLSIGRMALEKNNKVQVRMQMQVQPEQGRNFVTEIRQVLDVLTLENLSAGKKVQVIYDPSNMKDMKLVI